MSSCTDERNAQILIQVLKAHGIKKVIASPGTTNACLVSSMQSDPFFEIYSAPEERSGAYMACGMAAESGEPVVLSCTGATASRNYMPALTEAFYRKLPILTVTSSRRNAYIGHNCDQVTDRTVLPNDVAKISVQMPIVLDDVSEWNCIINANKAVLELYHRGGGPAHINLETTYSKKKVADDRLLNNTLCYNLNTAGYTVDSALTKSVASSFLTKQDYDLIVLDVNLPDGNGFDFCREIKERRPDTVIIFLTANDMESDMLKGYELGAEDYVTKPFPMSVFQKKLAVVLGRLTKQYGGDTYEDGTLTINFSEMSATLSGKPLTFTPLEYRLLKILMKNPQIVLTRQVLLEKLWDADGNFVDEHALTAAISRVRNKIETPDRQYIKTVYGMGYMWIGGALK